MSFNINSDKEFIRGSKPQLIGDNELTIRSGVASSQREVLRAQLDTVTGLPRVGINRTGQRVNNVTVVNGGSGYTTPPSVILGPPQQAGGTQALASAFIFNGQVVNIAINNPGTGYTSAPTVTINSDSGVGAVGEAFLDTVDYELDINGAIRTSTSIISDTARILNLDIDNFITPDANFRAPNLKTFVNNTGIPWDGNVIIQKDSYRYFGANVYQALNTGKTDPQDAPTHVNGVELNGEVQFKHIGFRVVDENAFGYNETGDAGVFPRSITPLLGDRSDKIATTEYVLNLATNDVGGRIYVSQQIGNDENDGRSAVNPVRTIKKACQLAWQTPGVKETVIVSGGDYVEDNPISIPPDASIVGDNLRLVIIRPANPGKHIMKFGDKNYVTGVTYRDQIDSLGDPVATWDFAMVFDDKQRIIIDQDANGDFGTEWPVGHQIFGPDQFRVDFQENTGLSSLQTGLEVVGVNTGSRATIIGVTFDTTIGADAYTTGSLDVTLNSGSFLEGERFNYIVTGSPGSDTTLTVTEYAGDNKLKVTDDPSTIIPAGSYVYIDDSSNSVLTQGYYEVRDINDDNSPNFWIVEFVPILGSSSWDSLAATNNVTISSANVITQSVDTTSLESIRAEGEVVKIDEDITAVLPIQKIDFSLQGDPSIATGGFQNEQFGNAEDLGGIIFYTNELVGRSNIHDFKEGQEILIEGLPTSNPDLSFLNGKQRIYKVLEDADGRCRRFVIPKKYPALTQADFDPGQFATVKSYSKSVTLSLLNSPNTFKLATPVERRFQDACVYIRNNRDFIADEVVGKINDEFKKEYFSVYDIGGDSSAQFTPTNATYDPSSGEAVFTINNHGLSPGEGIRIDDESIVFTCTMDGNKTEHATPQSHHYASGKTLPIISTTTNTITVNVGASGQNQSFTPAAVDYDPSTGNVTMNIGNHTLSVGEGIIFEDNSLSFTCDMDGNQSVKTYPRPGIDPYAGKSIKITAVTAETITVNVGASRENEYFTPTAATYDAATGDLTVTVGQHGLGVGRSVVLADNSFTFTCDQDGNATQHTYPRPGSDPYAGKSIEITSVGLTQHTITNATYDPSTGISVITIPTHGFSQGDYIKLDDNSLTFTCDLDGNTAQKSYPRSHDYASGRWLKIDNVTQNTFEVNVGTGGADTSAHTFISATSNGLSKQDGTFTINVGDAGTASGSTHTFVSASLNAIKHEPQSQHTFAGATTGAVKHLPQSAHTFVRAAANSIKVGGSEFKIYLGTSRFEHTYISGGTVEFGGSVYNVSGFTYDNSSSGTAVVTTSSPIPSIANDSIVKLANIIVECNNGQKAYPSFNIPVDDNQCRQDIVHFLNALVRDLEFGSNHNIIEAGQKYIVGAKIGYVENEIIQTVRAIEYARELATYAMCNWRTGNRTPSDPIYTPQYSSVNRYFDNSVITATAGTPACDDVRSAIDTLSFLFVDVIANDTSGTYLDAAYLIARNRDLIADQSLIDTETQYPSLGLSDINQRKCRRDINFILGGLIRDLALGGNSGIITNAEAYFTGAALTGIDASQLDETRYAYSRVERYAKAAMRNWSDGSTIDVTPSFATYDASNGTLTVSFADPVEGTVTTGSRIAFKEGALTFNCDSNGGGDLASPTPTDRNYGKSLEITNVTSGSGVTTVTCNVGPAGTASSSTHTFVSALNDGTIIIFDPVTPGSPIPKFEDWNILLYSTTPICANVESTINTEFGILDGILEYAEDPDSPTSIEPGSITPDTGTLFDATEILTYPDSFIYDANNQRVAVRGFYDDYPIIEASPYTQNASVISFLGGSGALIDGSKVKQPNCPFPGLELDGTATYPNQGKSMVAAAFTIVSFGGTGYKIVEDGYVQLVSVFVIFCADGVLAESGGYASITNSATNFGIYALRAIGYRDEAYSFDVGTITNVSSTPTGRTIFTVGGLGREPLEHYVVKIDGYSNTNTEIEFFIDSVGAVTVGPPFTAQLTIDNGTGGAVDLTSNDTGQQVSTSGLVGETIRLHRPSIVNSSSHTWEFAGSGTNYLALPENGGTKVDANEQVSENYGRVYCSGTDELGDFKVGTFAKIENRTGNITFTGTVTISEVEFLKLKGGDVVVTGFDASNTLGGANASDSKIPTQKSVRDYITNNLGPYINKPYSTNAVPRALVELTDSGKISVDQIPALRPFEVYTVANQTERLAIEGALAGDIAIEQDTSTSYILNNDLDSQFLAFAVNTSLQFTIGDIFTGSVSGGRIQATEYRQGVVYRINVTNGGSGYASPPTVTLSGGTPQSGSVEAKAESVIANGEVVAIDIVAFNGYVGGRGYTVPPTVTVAAPAGSGTQAQASSLIESRLYGSIVNRIKIEDTDTFESSDVPSETVNINRAVNTSSFNSNNWVSLSSNQISATDIVSGVIESDRLASGGAANSFTFLRGDQNFALAVQSIKGAEKRYFAKLLQNFNSGSSEMVFSTLADALIGHEILDNVTGIQPNTNITGVLTTGGTTTISVNNPAIATIPAGTVIEFERGASPIIFDSTYTQGNFVDDIVISNGGTGFTNGQYFDIDFVGGTGTGLKANFTITGGSITELLVTDGGSGYDGDFTITVPPTEIGAGSGLVLLAKVSTVNRQYANVSVDIQRVSDLTISSDLYGTIGVARFKKSQFTIGQAGNGSIDLNVGADSGLDADLLDGAQGAFYLNSSNQNSGTLPTDRLSGTYNISVSGSSGNSLRLTTGTNNPTSNPTPDNFVGGIVANTINNSANQLSDGGSKNLVMTIRAGGSSFDASFGGVRQLAFTDNDNMWIRGSGTGVTSFGSWGKVWSSLNDGIGSGLDADRLDNKQGTWYQNALNINSGTLSDNRLPDFIDETSFKDTIKVKSYNGDPRYKIYISGLILNTSPFVPGNPVNLYNANGQGTGTIEIDNIIINNDTIDNSNDYTIIIGRLTTGNFIGALTIGDAGNRKEFQDFTIDEGNTIDIVTLESDGGTANLKMGRTDGVSSSPGIYFNSSQLVASYNAAIVATGGNATSGSGSLNTQVENADAFTINGNVIWNAGNIEFQSENVQETAVKRDASGNFKAGTIEANLTGAASENVLVDGDDMQGRLRILNVAATSEALSVSGITNLLSDVTVAGDLNVDSGTLFVDASQNTIGINVGTTLTQNLSLDVKGGSAGALRVRGVRDIHHLYFDSRNDYNDDSNHVWIWVSDGNTGGAFPSEGGHLVLNGRASDRDIVLRTNSSNKLVVQGNGGVVISNSGTNDGLTVDKNIVSLTGIQIANAANNNGAPLIFKGASGFRNFRVGNNLIGDNIFSIESSSDAGGINWDSTNRVPALAITVEDVSGTDVHRIGINTAVFEGNDPEANNQLRKYVLNVEGDINLNGQFFQNNSEFVTSRWTESPNGSDIYRQSFVGINFSTDKDPGFALDVEGDFNVVGATYINGVKQYQDSQGIIKAYNTQIDYDVTLDDNSVSYSEGPIVLASGVDIVFGTNSSWTIL